MSVTGPSRRTFLSETALAAAAVGLGPGIVSLLAAERSSPRPWLDVAIRCGQWIDKAAQDRDGGLAWPADPLKPAAIGLDFYNGTPGVVYFFANLYAATGDARWRERADRGGAYLVAESARAGEKLNTGLYTGTAGLGTTYMALAKTKVGASWTDHAKKAAATLTARARTAGDGADWSDSNDIVSGTAGTGLFLLDAASAWKDRSLRDLAARAGRRLIAQGVPAEGGLMWFPAGQRGANYPNFSHGTAGVAYFLATLHEATHERAYLDAALAGVKYFDAVSTRRDNARAIFHVTGGGENRFYLSWCHGPVGTARLFYRLLSITGDQRHHRSIGELTSWLMSSGAPEQQSAGYWNNISQCCGNVGIGQYAIDLARHRLPWAAGLGARVVKNTMSRATDDASGLRWVQAENRVSPENVVAQTGFMQGAAGVGTFFLQLDAYERKQRWPTPLPDTPWT
ncbi:MAG TPA: lanthionine synthetase LanC family protein [Vicinamibacterales bacterium]|nr:lanthionine synthetase LanC family protein [Vicinamibacterales bacterium]